MSKKIIENCWKKNVKKGNYILFISHLNVKHFFDINFEKKMCCLLIGQPYFKKIIHIFSERKFFTTEKECLA